MKISDAVAAIKEFFLEILGFLLPGLMLLLLMYLFLREEYKVDIDMFLGREQAITIIVVISYILGYVLFGISDYWNSFKRKNKLKIIFKFLQKHNLIKSNSYFDDLEKQIKGSAIYEVCKRIICETVGIEKDKLDEMSSREVRNIAMSFVPEVDRKIYNFMFRAELSDKVSMALKIVAIIGLGSYLSYFDSTYYWPFKTNDTTWLFYLLLFVIAYFLRQTQRRFYSIAMRIVFPIFVAKFKGQKDSVDKSLRND